MGNFLNFAHPPADDQKVDGYSLSLHGQYPAGYFFGSIGEACILPPDTHLPELHRENIRRQQS